MSRVYIHLLVWNDRRYLPDLFDSLGTQTYKDATVRVLDNGSTDETLAYIQAKHSHTLVVRNRRNMGFAPAHNQLLRFTMEHLAQGETDPFILLLNSDMILHPRLVEELVQALDRDKTLAAVQPKLYKAFGEVTGDNALTDVTLSDILDTTGMTLHKGLRMTDRGAGQLDDGRYDNQTDLFGPTGTCALFRLSALHDVMIDNDVFDNDFFAYKEDCDLALRLQKAGWKTKFVPTATAHHYRGMYGAQKQSWRERLKNRRSQRPFFAALSTRNQLFLLAKHLTLKETLRLLPTLLFHEGGRVVYGFVFEKETRKQLLQGVPTLFKMLRKRRHVKRAPHVTDEHIAAYVSR